MSVRGVLSAFWALGLLSSVCAQEKPVRIDIKDAASLIGKTLDEDTQYATGTDAPRESVGDWSYGFEFDDAGLMRTASAKEHAKGEARLSTAFAYNRHCKRAVKDAEFTFIVDERFPLKGSESKGRRTEAWIHLGTSAAFDPKPAKASLAFSENDGALHLKLDPALMTRHERIALCPTAAAPAAKTGRCAIFSLAGFARAYDFVCEAK